MKSPSPPFEFSLRHVLAASMLLAVPFHVRPDNFIVDDGYFYPEIARYIAHGAGSTFNGIVYTNGYHPLWMLVCVAAAKITSASGPLVQVLSLVQDLLTLASLALLVSLSRSDNKRGAALGCAPILFFSMVLGIWRLLEANLALSLQLAVIAILVPAFPPVQARVGKWRDPLLGFLLGLTLLARLDLIFFVIVVLWYQLLNVLEIKAMAGRAKSVLLQGLIVTALVMPYLIWNLSKFRHLEPISGAIKSTFPHIRPLQFEAYTYPVIMSIVLNGLLFAKKKLDFFDVACLLTASAALLHLAYTLCFGGLAPWYLTTGYLSVCFCIIWLVDTAVAHWPTIMPLVPAATVTFFVSFLTLASLRLVSNFSYSRLMHHDVLFHGSYAEPKKALAERLRATLPSGSRIFIFDAPGGVAYYSGMSIIPADGLVSDYAYNQDIIRDGFSRYAASHEIDYFIAPYVQKGEMYNRLFLKMHRCGRDQEVEVHAPLGDRSAGIVSLPDSALVFRFREVNPDLEKSFPELGIWRLDRNPRD